MNFLEYPTQLPAFFFLTLLSLLPISLHSQPFWNDIPSIDRSLDFYTAPGERIISGACDMEGRLFIGTNQRILMYDGMIQAISSFQGNSVLIMDDQGVLFAGAYNEFGYFIHSQGKLPQFVSQKQLFPDEPGSIIQLIAYDHAIYILADQGLYIRRNNSIQAIPLKDTIRKLFRTAGGLYAEVAGRGLCSIDSQNQLITVLPFDEAIAAIINEDKEFLIYTTQGKQFRYDQSLRVVLPASSDKSSFTGGIAGVMEYNKRQIISTEGDGIYLLEQADHKETLIHLDSELRAAKVIDVLDSHQGFLYLLHPASIDRLCFGAKTNLVPEINGVVCTVNKIEKFGGKLYFATNHGIITIEDSLPHTDLRKTDVSTVQGIKQECLDIFNNNGRLYFTLSDGLYIQENLGVRKIIGLDHAILALISHYNDSTIITVADKGLKFYRFDGLLWKAAKVSPAWSYPIAGMKEVSNQTLLINTGVGELFLLKYRIAGDSVIIQNQLLNVPFSKSGTNKIFSIQDNVIISARGGLYRFDPSLNSFYRLPVEGEQLSEREVDVYYPLVREQGGNFLILRYVASKNWLNALLICKLNGNALIMDQKIGIDELEMHRMNDIGLGTGNELWIGGEALLELSRLKKDSTHLSLPVIISSVIFRSYTLHSLVSEWNGEKPSLPNRYNALQITFGSIYPEVDPIYYSYVLSGPVHRHEEWTKIRTVEFDHLRPGNYTFRIDATTADGSLKGFQKFSFRILQPFYIRWFAFFFYLPLLAFFLFLLIRWRSYSFLKEKINLENIISMRTDELRREKEKTEQLLANMLPKDTADELKKRGKASAQKYDLVTVLFSDIQGFTKIAEQMNPETLVDQLDSFYFHFDSVVEKFNIEKIKTIGDAYMCAGGIPEKNRTNPIEVVLAALEVQDYMRDLKSRNSDIWDLRIGIHTGPVVAGVIGHKKFSYDIWGDTVNTASRMESSGEAGKINISGHTYDMVKDFFVCEYRGKMPVKYKGEIDMYFVKGIRPELSVDLYRIPNNRFFVQLQKMRLTDMEEFILSRLEIELAPKICFHTMKHTMEIYSLAELLGRAEDLSDEDLLLVRTAALMIDTGYLFDDSYPVKGAIDYAKEILPHYKFNARQTEQVVKLIEIQDSIPVRLNDSQRILADAVSNYFGRVDFTLQSENLYKELTALDKVHSREEWILQTMKQIEEHNFHTNTAEKLREVTKVEQLELLKKLK